MIPNDDAAGRRVDEWAIVRFDGRTEEIALRLESSTALERAALIMPLPARATFALGDDAAFDRFAALTRPRRERRTRYTLFGGGDDDGDASPRSGRAPASGGVQVVDTQDLGPLRVTTLRGRDARAVGTYLDDHGFPTPPGVETSAQAYLDQGWLLAAVSLRGERGRELRRLQPLVMRFPTAAPIYPLRMSRLAPSGSRARVDLVAPRPYTVDNWPAGDAESPSDARGGRLFAGPLPGGRYLTTFRFVVRPGGAGAPSEDPRFATAERDDFRQAIVAYEEVALWPYLLGGLALLAAVAAVSRRAVRRARSTGFR